MTDITATEAMKDVVASNTERWIECRSKPQNIGWFVGQVMKACDGKADYDLVYLVFEATVRAERAEAQLKNREEIEMMNEEARAFAQDEARVALHIAERDGGY